MQADHFECSDILLKCPSKYKDDEKQMQKNVNEQTKVES
jgi:cytochrome c-type biogenesis protein CcmE